MNAVIYIVAIIIFWQVYDLLVSVVKSQGRVIRFKKWVPAGANIKDGDRKYWDSYFQNK